MVIVPKPVTVLLANQSEVSRLGLRSLLLNDDRFKVVGDVPVDVVGTAQRLQPELIVFDPAGDGSLNLQPIDELHRVAPAARLLILTSFFEPHAFMAAMLRRVHGYLLKDSGGQGVLLMGAFALVGRYGAVVVDTTIAEYFWSLPGLPIAVRVPGPGAQRITQRQREVLQLVVEGLKDRAIADRLGIKAGTVDYHVQRLREHLGARTRGQLATIAVEQGLAPPPSRFPGEDS